MSPAERKKIKVLIVDDSALIRKLLTGILNSSWEIEVVGTAPDPYIARDKIKKLNPDVLTLDVEMPKMDGISFLSNLMRLRPMPVVMVSSLTEKGADVTLEALELGAVDYISKPKIDIAEGLSAYSAEIIEKVKIAAYARVRAFVNLSIKAEKKYSADAVIQIRKPKKHLKTTEKIIAIGASTGGTEVIKHILMAMPAHAPGIVITQHMPESFTAAFAERMDRFSALTVCEASDNQQILPGHAYIAPGNQHLMVKRSGARYLCQLQDGLPVNRHRPSVDVLFRSVSQNVGPNAIGILLTGMGTDGAQGLKEMQEAGAETIIQDESSSVVWGMPGEAYRINASNYVEPVERIPSRIQKVLEKMDHVDSEPVRKRGAVK